MTWGGMGDPRIAAQNWVQNAFWSTSKDFLLKGLLRPSEALSEGNPSESAPESA